MYYAVLKIPCDRGPGGYFPRLEEFESREALDKYREDNPLHVVLGHSEKQDDLLDMVFELVEPKSMQDMYDLRREKKAKVA